MAQDSIQTGNVAAESIGAAVGEAVADIALDSTGSEGDRKRSALLLLVVLVVTAFLVGARVATSNRSASSNETNGTSLPTEPVSAADAS